MLNKIILMGRLTRDPELRTISSGASVTSFTLAVDRDYTPKGEERQTDFIDIVAWRATADFVAKWFRKGQLVAVAGRLQSRKWEDKEGNKRISFEVVADEVHFAEKKGDGPSPAPYKASAVPAGEPGALSRRESPLPFDPDAPSSFSEMDDDGDLPF